MIARAADAGADLVVLPELCSSGYVFEPGNLGGAVDRSSNGPLTARGSRLPDIAPGRVAEQ